LPTLLTAQTHPHPDVDLRKQDVINERAAGGRAIIYEDPAGEIYFSSITYEYAKANTNDTHPEWAECGSTQAATGGLGLYPLTISSQVIYSFLTDPPYDKFIGSFSKSSPNVAKLILGKVGWKLFTPDQDCLEATKSTKDVEPDNSQRNWAGSPSSCLPHQARIILETLNDSAAGKMIHKQTQAKIKLDVSDFPLANELRPMLEELAYGKFGQYLEATADMKLGHTRELLEQYMNLQFTPPNTGPQPGPQL